MGNVSNYLSLALIVLAVCAVAITAILFHVARHLTSSTASLKTLIDTVDVNIRETVTMVQTSIDDVNTITKTTSGQMEKVEEIAENVRLTSGNIRTTMHVIEKTAVPLLGNFHAISAGLRKAIETWNDYGKENGQ